MKLYISIAETLTTADRDELKDSDYGLPKKRKYPMPDKAHAGNAKARAKQQLMKGELTKSEYEQICRKADRLLGAK